MTAPASHLVACLVTLELILCLAAVVLLGHGALWLNPVSILKAALCFAVANYFLPWLIRHCR